MSEYTYITKYSSKNYTPASKVKAAFGYERKITGITIHWWGARGQKFQNVVNYLCRSGGNTSAHYIVEAGRVACIVAPKNAAWHSGSAKGNATTIGLELRPEATDGDYATAAQLIRDLRKEYGDLPLIPHRAWKSTACPGQWDLDRLDKLARGGAVKPAASPVKKPAASAPKKVYKTLRLGSVGAQVKAVQKALYGEGYTKQKRHGIYTPQTKANVKDYQRRVGLYQDGIAGPITQRKLGL